MHMSKFLYSNWSKLASSRLFTTSDFKTTKHFRSILVMHWPPEKKLHLYAFSIKKGTNHSNLEQKGKINVTDHIISKTIVPTRDGLHNYFFLMFSWVNRRYENSVLEWRDVSISKDLLTKLYLWTSITLTPSRYNEPS